MNRIRLAGAAVLLLALAVATRPHPVSAAQTTPRPATFIGSTRDTGQFLPDTAVIVRVGSRKATVYDFRDGYYAIYPEMRPSQDSLGRAEFMANIVRKEVLGQTANRINRPLSFEDRAKIKEYNDRLLANVLYGRAVDDSINLTEPELRKVHSYYGNELRLRHLVFQDRAEAERVRLQLLRGQLSWSVAAARYALRDSLGKPVASEMNWVRFESVPPVIALQLWALRVGEFSSLIVTPGGYHLAQVIDSRRRDKVPSFDGLRTSIQMVLRQVQTSHFRKLVQEEAMRGFDLHFDSTAIAVASRKFHESMKTSNEGFATTFTFDATVPEFNMDESRMVVARWNGGRDSMTIEHAVHEYTDLPLIGRPSLNTPEDFQEFCLNTILEPRLVEVAKRRGFDRDSVYLALTERKVEEIRVTHMVEDSVFSKIVVTKADRQKYYQDHLADFRTYPSAHYAMFIAMNRPSADSLKAVLDKGGDPAKLVADWKAKHGEDNAKLDEEVFNQPTYVHKLAFEELRPGQSTVNGPDAAKHFIVVKLIDRNDGRQLSYDEAERYVDESLQNLLAQQGLDAFTERLKKNFVIETHPERLMRIRLVDTAGD